MDRLNKNNFKILLKRNNADKIARGYLIQDLNAEYQPYIVCSYFKEIENDRVTWDWGHYFSDLDSAVKFYYEIELEKALENINIIVKNKIGRFEVMDRNELRSKEIWEIKDIVSGLGAEIEKEITELFHK